MFTNLSGEMSSAVSELALILAIVISLCHGQRLQCTNDPLIVEADGTINFEPLPAGESDEIPAYNPGAVGGWYDLAGRFVDAVRPGSLPYGKLCHGG